MKHNILKSIVKSGVVETSERRLVGRKDALEVLQVADKNGGVIRFTEVQKMTNNPGRTANLLAAMVKVGWFEHKNKEPYYMTERGKKALSATGALFG